MSAQINFRYFSATLEMGIINILNGVELENIKEQNKLLLTIYFPVRNCSSFSAATFSILFCILTVQPPVTNCCDRQ